MSYPSVSDSDPLPFDVPRPVNNWRSPGPRSGISPVEVGCVSVDGNGEFVDDRSQSRFYRPPPSLRGANTIVDVCWDLRRGYETWIRRDDSLDDFLDGLLWWLQVHGHAPTHVTAAAAANNVDRPVDEDMQNVNVTGHTASGVAEQITPFADLFCCRSLITKVLGTPYQTHPRCPGWKLVVCRYNGVLYGNDKDGDNRGSQFDIPSGNSIPDFGIYGGYKFETYLAAACKDAEPDIEAPVNNKQSLLTVVKTCFGDHQLAYISDVDCFDATTNKPIELKTCFMSDDPRSKYNIRWYKTMEWWAQCVLNATSKVVCGFKDKNFIVRQLREYTTSQLAEQTTRSNRDWNADFSFKFCDKFIKYIKQTVTEDFDKVIYVFNYNPSRDNHHVTCQVHTADSEGYSQHAFLPSWFTGDTVHCRSTRTTATATGH